MGVGLPHLAVEGRTLGGTFQKSLLEPKLMNRPGSKISNVPFGGKFRWGIEVSDLALEGVIAQDCGGFLVDGETF